MVRPGQAVSQRVIDALTELVLTSGSLSKASLQQSRHRNYFRRVRERGGIDWAAYFETLARYDVDHTLVTQWAHCVTNRPTLERFGASALARALIGEPVETKRVRLAYLRGELPPDGQAILRNATLDELDELRYADPAAAEEQARAVLRRADSVGLAARALGVWGSALKYCNRLDDAHTALWTGIRIAASARLPSLLGDLVHRSAYVVSEQGAFEGALELAQSAQRIFEDEGNSTSVGQTLVTQGVMLDRLGQAERAAIPFTKALELISPSDKRGRYTALQCLAGYAAQNGELREANDLATQAGALAPDNAYFQARLTWLQARLAQAENENAVSEELFTKATAAFGNEWPTEAAMVVAEHVRLLIKLFRFEEARYLASTMRWIVIPLQDKIPAAAAAFADLVIVADSARLFSKSAQTLAHRIEAVITTTVGDRCIGRPQEKSTI